MADAFLTEKLARARLHQRCSFMDDGGVVFRLRSGAGWVRLTSGEWDALGHCFATALRPSSARVRLAMYSTIPFALALLALIANVPALDAAAAWLDRAVPGVAPLLVTCGLPLAAILGHGLAVSRAVAEVEEAARRYPLCDPPAAAPARTGLNALELIALFVIGPGLLVKVYGSIHPEGLRNTPMTGQHIDITGAIGIAVVVALLVLRARERMRASAGPALSPSASFALAPPAVAPPAARGFGRKAAP